MNVMFAKMNSYDMQKFESHNIHMNPLSTPCHDYHGFEMENIDKFMFVCNFHGYAMPFFTNLSI